MIYVGIDIAKLNLFAAAISSDGEILIDPFKFTNDYDGFYLLLSNLAHTIEQIVLLDSQLIHSELEMANLVTYLHSVIMIIPGISAVNGRMILGENGDIHRFPEPKKLLAFAGLDPSVHQSGNFQAQKTRISRRGSRVLRYALMNAAHNVVKNNATFRTYYDA